MKKFVIVRLNGGLGNQMFQYAAAYALSKKLNLKLYLDLSLLKQDKLRDYNLNCFKISGKIINDFEFKKKFLLPLKIIRKFNFLNNIISNISFYTERSFNFDDKIFNLKGNICLDGYWQSEKYFKEFSSSLKKEFVLNKTITKRSEKILNKIQSTNSISCHVRRSDYVNDKKTNLIHGSCSLDWYKKSFKLIKQKIKNPVFFVFSDDIKWTKNNFPDDKAFIFADTYKKNKDYEDLYLMSKCNHNIIANSSFSWWSAWLNQNSHKIVIYPRNWFQIKVDIKDLIPYDWISL